MYNNEIKEKPNEQLQQSIDKTKEAAIKLTKASKKRTLQLQLTQ